MIVARLCLAFTSGGTSPFRLNAVAELHPGPIFGNLKTWLRGTFRGVSRKHLQRYLDEFVYRFDRRWREGELFGFVLNRAASARPLSYHRLVAETAE